MDLNTNTSDLERHVIHELNEPCKQTYSEALNNFHQACHINERLAQAYHHFILYQDTPTLQAPINKEIMLGVAANKLENILYFLIKKSSEIQDISKNQLIRVDLISFNILNNHIVTLCEEMEQIGEKNNKKIILKGQSEEHLSVVWINVENTIKTLWNDCIFKNAIFQNDHAKEAVYYNSLYFDYKYANVQEFNLNHLNNMLTYRSIINDDDYLNVNCTFINNVMICNYHPALTILLPDNVQARLRGRSLKNAKFLS